LVELDARCIVDPGRLEENVATRISAPSWRSRRNVLPAGPPRQLGRAALSLELPPLVAVG
jgi:hypothetical protein